MRRLFLVLSLAGLATQIAAAQSLQRHHFTAGLGAAVPQEDLSSIYKNGFSWTFGYGFRPVSLLQLDVGLDTVYNAADVDEYWLDPAFGYLRVRDFEYMVPMGARLVVPVTRGGRFTLHGGGGGAYLRYSESLRQPSDYFQVSCPVCRARDGWGYYLLAGGDFAVTEGGRLKLGVVTRVYMANTDGRGVGSLPAVKTKDRWINTYFHFTFSF